MYRPPEQPRYAPPPPADPLRVPLQHGYAQVRDVPPPRAGLPTWALVILFAFAFLGLIGAVFYGYQRWGHGGTAGFTGGETPPATASKSKAGNSVQKYIEVVGIRLTQDAKKKLEARFVVVNHASTELSDLAANVTLWASTSRSEEDSVGTFSFKLDGIAPHEAKEITVPLKTKLKIYELPDWQNLTAEVQVTSP